MKISERQTKILNTIVQEYIDSAEPISSELLEKKYDFGICPATIRIEMQKLTDKGFLLQPHTSAGRVPTDRGYRFFVDILLARQNFTKQNLDGLEKGISEIEETLRGEREDIISFIHQLSKYLATASSDLVTIHLLEKDLSWKEGWEEVLMEPEFEKKGFLFGFTELLENFEENIQDLEINSGIKVYIGKENPFPKAKDFSIISSRCYLPDAQEAILALLGPKRMDYDRNISLINSLTKILENF